MAEVEATVTQVTVEEPGRRQRKKQRTRDALVSAAMRLFTDKGYERTAIHEITDAVDVSERTFFRYFASKEDLMLSFIRDGQDAFAEALAARPPQEEPLTAVRNAYHLSLRSLLADTMPEPGAPSFLAVMRLVDSTPALLAAYLRCVHDRDWEIVEILARREGVDSADRRPTVLAAVVGALVFQANRDWEASGSESLDDMESYFDAYAEVLLPALSGHWS
jgi:AcrR family transcriptional regulator